MEIAVLLYDRFTALDCIGPYEVLAHLPGADLKFVSRDGGIVRSDTGKLAIATDYSIDDVPKPDMILVPGGPGDEGAGGRSEASLLGSGRPTRPPSGRRRSAPARSCSARPAS